MISGNHSQNNTENILLTLATSNISSDLLTLSFHQDIIVPLPSSSDLDQPSQLTAKDNKSELQKQPWPWILISTCRLFWPIYCLLELLVIFIHKTGLHNECRHVEKGEWKIRIGFSWCEKWLQHKQTDY